MKTQLWVYIVVAVLSLGAGVAIAGVPTFEEREATIAPPTDASAASPSDAATDAEAEVDATPDSDAPLFEAAETNGDVAIDATADTSSAVDETEADEPAAQDTTTTSTTTTTVPLIDRAVLEMAAANGANVGGAASSASAALEAAGYADVVSFDGGDIVEVTVIFAGEGLQAEAERLAADIGIEPTLVFPLPDAPGIDSLSVSVEIVVYLGRDVVDLDFFS